MKNDRNNNQTGKVNYIWVLAGGYLIYLAYKLFRDLFKGDAPNVGLSIGCGILFVVVGAYALYREWRAYKFGLDHIDDPSTWSDEEEDEQLAELMGAAKAGVEEQMGEEPAAEEASEEEEGGEQA